MEIIKDTLTGFFVVIIAAGIFYGIYKLIEWIVDFQPILMAIPFVLLFFYIVGRVLRENA
jgi:uncharacterized membrane protein